MSRATERRAEREARRAGRVKAPDRRWSELPRQFRFRVRWMAWRKRALGGLACRLRDHQWRPVKEYRTNRTLKGFESCDRCWIVRDRT